MKRYEVTLKTTSGTDVHEFHCECFGAAFENVKQRFIHKIWDISEITDLNIIELPAGTACKEDCIS